MSYLRDFRVFNFIHDLFSASLVKLRERLQEEQEREKKEESELRRLDDIIYKLERGHLHSSERFSALLHKNGITHQTGDSFLKLQDPEYAQQLLTKNPILPFCFIVSDKDFEKALDISAGHTEEMVCPVIRRSDAENVVLTEDNAVVSANIKLYGLGERRTLNRDDIESYLSDIYSQKEQLKEQIIQTSEACNQLELDIHTLSNFDITKEYAENANMHLSELENERMSLDEKSKRLQESLTQLDETLHKLDDDISGFQATLHECEKKKAAFEEYLIIKQDCIDLEQSIAQQEIEIKKISEKITDLSEEQAELERNTNELTLKKAGLSRDKTDISEEKSKFISYEECSIIPSSLDALKKEYDDLHSAYADDMKKHEEDFNRAQNEINKWVGKLRTEYPDITEDEIPTEYSYTDKMRSAEEYEKHKRAYSEIDLDIKGLEKEQKSLKKELERRRKELQDHGLTEPLSVIKGRYEERLTECKEQKDKAEENLKAARKQYNDLSLDITEISKIIDIDTFDDFQEISEQIDIKAERTIILQKRSTLQSKQGHIVQKYSQLCSTYSEHEHITAILSTVQAETCSTYDESLRCYDHLKDILKLIGDKINIHRTTLESAEDDRREAIRQLSEQGEMLYKEVKRLNLSSHTEIQGKRQPVIVIEIPERITSEDIQNRFSTFIDNKLFSCVSNLQAEAMTSQNFTNKPKISAQIV